MGRQRLLLALILILSLAAVGAIVKFPTRLGLDLQGGTQITLQVKTTPAVPTITPEKLEGVQQVVENRVNGLGVSEAVVQTVGEDQLLVQLPGVSDPDQAERVLGGTAQLDFRAQRQGTETQLGIEFQVRQEVLAEQEQLKTSSDQAAIAENQAALRRSDQAIAVLFDKTELTGDKLKTAYAQPLNGNTWQVGLEFNEQGATEFAELTKSVAGTGRGLGIFLDDRLLSAPTVEARYAETGITGGGASITGGFDSQRAIDLSVQLKGGALPVPVEVIENRTVGATLGRDSIERSIYASVGSLVLVLIFLGVYYLLPGLIADLALVIYALLTWAGFALLGVTMTLPGVAGFILSIGMAVDANVLIFERTKEELQAGKSLYRSVESGFYRAFAAILDGNVTVIIACGALWFFGAGLVKGFAATLFVGVLVSFFTAVTCSRTLLMTAISFPALRKPQFFTWKPNTTAEATPPRRNRLSVNKTRHIWWTLSAIAILTGLVAMGISWSRPDIRAPLRPSLEFVGGTKLQFERDCAVPNNCDRPINLDEVRNVLVAQELGNSSIQILGTEQQAFSIRATKLDLDQRSALQTALSEELGTFDRQKTQIDDIGPILGRQLLSSGLIALLVSFAGIVVYITLRYKLDFAIFAILALFHNVLVTLGIFSVLGLVQGVEVDSLFLVALLTITGFSVNDTVVIYDRIRELLEINPDRPIREVVDDAVNQTLARSLNIAFIVMLTLFALLIFGGETLKYFALAQIVGFSCGLYTSIFIASTLLTWWRERTEKLVPMAIANSEVIDSATNDA